MQSGRAERRFGFLRRWADAIDRALRPHGVRLEMSARRAIACGRELLREEIEGPRLWSPRVDVVERDERYIIRADLPGVHWEDFKVQIVDGMLWIEGSRRPDREDARCGFCCCQRQCGPFCRAVPLPEGASLEQAVVTFRDGVLELAFPLP